MKSILLSVLTVLALNSCTEKVYVETDKPTLYVHSYEKQVFEPFTLDYKVVRDGNIN